METVGRNNPNAKEWYCPRQDCEPCKGRRILGAEEAEDTIRRAEGHQVPKRTREDRTALPCCTDKELITSWSVSNVGGRVKLEDTIERHPDLPTKGG